MAACLASGLWGVEHAVEPPPPVQGDATGEDAEADPLPPTLDAATAMLSASEVAREILGEAFVDHYVRTRDWEVRRYFESV